MTTHHFNMNKLNFQNTLYIKCTSETDNGQYNYNFISQEFLKIAI
jgi:hypothetical protein